MLALAVKGNRYQAECAAESRGISFAVQRESRYGETIFVTAMEHLELVRAWHGENAGGNDDDLPIGGLLCWSQLPYSYQSPRFWCHQPPRRCAVLQAETVT